MVLGIVELNSISKGWIYTFLGSVWRREPMKIQVHKNKIRNRKLKENEKDCDETLSQTKNCCSVENRVN